MNIQIFPLGMMATNCYVLYAHGQAVVVDPGDSRLTAVYDFIEHSHLSVRAALLTHGHYDHIGGVNALSTQYHCPALVHEQEAVMLTDPIKNLSATLFRRPYTVSAPIETFSGGQTLFADTPLALEVLHTPGHTPGSCCFFAQDTLLCGDTLFASSAGRTDFPGGSMGELLVSLARIRAACGEQPMTAYPGHGDQISLPDEFLTNPYYRGQ